MLKSLCSWGVILSVQCSNVSLFVGMFMCYLMTIYLNIHKFDKNIALCSYSWGKGHDEGNEKLVCCLEEGENEELRFFFLKYMLVCEIDYIFKQHKMILIELRLSSHVGLWNLPEIG